MTKRFSKDKRFSKEKLSEYLEDAYENQTKRFDHATKGLSVQTSNYLQLNNHHPKEMYDILSAEVANGNMTGAQMVEVITVLSRQLDHRVMGYQLKLNSLDL